MSRNSDEGLGCGIILYFCGKKLDECLRFSFYMATRKRTI